MSYLTLAEKIHRLFKKGKAGKKKVALPKDILESISSNISLKNVCTFPSHFTPEEKEDSYIFDNLAGFFLILEEVATRNNTSISKRYEIVLKSRDVIKVVLHDYDLYNQDVISRQMKKTYDIVKPGNFVVAAQEVFLLKDFSKILLGGFEHTNWDLILEEGAQALVVTAQKIEDVYFIKILYNKQIYWAFGAMISSEFYNDKKNPPENHHYI